jgi:hypothetical protein
LGELEASAEQMEFVYVMSALVAWTVLAFVYRWVESRRGNRYAMSLAMGWSQAVLVLGIAVALGLDPGRIGCDHGVVGAGQGAIQVVLIPVFMAAVSRGDLSVTWTLLTLSFSLASVMALIYPGEHPLPLGWAGLALAAAAVGLLGLDMVHRSQGPEHRRPRRGWLPLMAVSFVLNAAAMYAYTVAEARAPDVGLTERLAFLAGAGGVFGLGGLAMLLVTRQWQGLAVGLAGGALGGLLTFCGALATLQAIAHGVPNYLVYPATTGGSNILVVLLSVAILKERPGRAGWAGIAVGLAAMVLFGLAA